MKSSNVRRSQRVSLAAAAAASLLAIQSASAQSSTINWTGAANDGGLWATPGNWDLNRTPVLEDDVLFGSTAVSVVLATGTSTMGIAGRMHFDNPGGITFTGNSGGNGLQLRYGILMEATSPSITIPGSMNLNGSSQSYI